MFPSLPRASDDHHSQLLFLSLQRHLRQQDDNFDALTADGEWAVVVYAPWCVHCQALKPTWAALAARLDGAVRVAQVDGTKQRALASRFRVEAYPSIYLLRPGGETYDYEAGPRTEDALADFALGGWRSYEPEPFWRSPHGAWGRAAGAALAAPDRLAASYTRLHRERGWPALAAVAALLAWPVAAGLAGIGLLDLVCTRRAVAAAKDAAARAAAAAGEAGAQPAPAPAPTPAAGEPAAPAAARPHAD